MAQTIVAVLISYLNLFTLASCNANAFFIESPKTAFKEEKMQRETVWIVDERELRVGPRFIIYTKRWCSKVCWVSPSSSHGMVQSSIKTFWNFSERGGRNVR